jgi:TonB-dependent receptor
MKTVLSFPRELLPLRTSIRAAFLFFAFGLLALTASAASPDTGTLEGLVMDASTGIVLEGAEVAIDGADHSVSVERGGRFAIRNLAPGSHRLTFRYPGLDDKTMDVTVAAGENPRLMVELGERAIQLETFKVEGTKEGMAQAVALQKSADEGKIVAATDQFGDMANGNVAEYLKFLPGVSIDGNAISLRGMSSALTNVTMDNNSMASASSGEMNRRFEFEQLAIDGIESVEIFKTLTPDRPATNTGGSVNLKTRSAFDRSIRYSHYSVYGATRRPFLDLERVPSVRSGELIAPLMPNFNLSYINRITRNVGIYVGASRYQSFGLTDRTEFGYSYNPLDGGNPDDPVVNAWRYHIERGTNTRRSFSTRVDWKVTPRTMLSASFAWNDFDMWFNYHQQGIYLGSLAPLTADQAVLYPVSGGEAHSRAGQGYLQLSQAERNKRGETSTVTLAFEHEFRSGAKLDASTYWSDASNVYDDIRNQTYGYVYPRISGLTTGLTNLGAAIPDYYARDAAGHDVDLNDLTKFVIPSFTTEPRTASDVRKGLSLDYSHPFAIGRFPVLVKAGGSYGKRERHTRKDFLRGGGGVPVGQVQDFADTIWSGFDKNELGVPGRSWVDLRKLYAAYSDVVLPPYQSPIDGAFDEDATAAYARVDVKPTNDLLIVAGVRHERLTSENYNGTIDERGAFKSQGNYKSLNIKYTPKRDLVLRAAVSQSVGLPDYGDLLPSSFDVQPPNAGVGSRGRIDMTNSNLKTYEVLNFDVGAEYYLRNAGVVSATAFRKKFTNYITAVTQALTPETAAEVGFDIGTISDPEEYDLVYKLNIPDPGYYSGIELSYSQTLGFLPPPLNTIGVQLNYTWIDIGSIESAMSFDKNNVYQDAAIREQVSHALDMGAVKNQFNMVLNWKFKKLTLLATVHSEGRVLKWSTINPVRYFRDAATYYMNEYHYMQPRTVVDLRVEYNLLRNFGAYVQFRDLFDAPIRYTANDRFLNYARKGNPMIEIGFKGWF